MIGSATLVLLSITFWIDGRRWQVIALTVSSALVAGTAAWARSDRLRVLSRASGDDVVTALVVLAGTAWGLPLVQVPAPTGPF